MNDFIEIAKLGRSIGTSGLMKCIIFTDFPNIFQKGNIFFIKPYHAILENQMQPLTLKSFNLSRSTIAFEEINSLEEAKKITNFLLLSSIEDTKKYCHLQQNEFFWFDIIGCNIFEDTTPLGCVKDIQRIANTDYLIIQTHKELSSLFAKEFLIPYLDHFIISVDIKNKKIHTKNTKNLLEAS